MSIDKSLDFGMDKFFFVQSDTTGVTYDYYGYMNKKGTILIMQTNKAVSEILYWVGTGVFATVFGLKTTYTYVLPNVLKDQII